MYVRDLEVCEDKTTYNVISDLRLRLKNTVVINMKLKYFRDKTKNYLLIKADVIAYEDLNVKGWNRT